MERGSAAGLLLEVGVVRPGCAQLPNPLDPVVPCAVLALFSSSSSFFFLLARMCGSTAALLH